MQKTNLRIGIMGAGAFGTSLAILYSSFNKITLFSAFEEHVNTMRKTHENVFLKGFQLSDAENIDIKHTLEITSSVFDYIFWCFPITPSLNILRTVAGSITKGIPIIICSKGITSRGTFLLDEFTKILPGNPIGIMSGPNFAVDVASLLFSAADIGFDNMETAEDVAKTLSNRYMRLVPTDDVIGLQIAGAVKNIIAIACGILVGLRAGQNAVAAALTLGLQEMSEIGTALGGKQKTFYGLSGVGDLMLTSSSETSRNMSLGKRIGQGENIQNILKNSCAVSEGAICLRYVVEISKKFNVKAPICNAVHNVISNKISPELILNMLIDNALNKSDTDKR